MGQKRKFYIIRRKKKASICSLFLQVLDNLYYCDKHNLIPIVDFKSDQLLCYDEKYGTNVWGYFFHPVSKYSLSDIKEYDKVSKTSSLPKPQKLHYYLGPAGRSRKYMAKFKKGKPPEFDGKHRKIFNWIIDKYVRVKNDLLCEVNSTFSQNFEGKKVISVFVRAANKYWNKIDGKMFSVDNYFKYIDFYLKERGANFVYLVIDNREAIPKFEKEYGKHLFYNKNFMRYPKYDQGEDLPWDEPGFGPVNGKSKGDLCKENLIETLLMSRCDFLIHPEGNMAISALLLNSELEHKFIL